MSKLRKLVVCTKGKKCPGRGSKQVLRELRNQAERQGLNVIVQSSDCLKLCKHGPSVLSLPDDVAYGGVTTDHCRQIVEAHATGCRVEQLIVQRKGKNKKR
jgi:(2Fe-2S) ferredoxin